MKNSAKPIKDLTQIADIKKFLKKKNESIYVLFMIGIYTWLKLEDILLLRVEDVKEEHINIREISTRKTQRILINPILKKAISPYIKAKPDNQYLFTNSENPSIPLTKDEALEILRKAATEVGIVEFDQDTMRKTFARAFFKLGIDMRLLKKILGESSVESVLEYIDWCEYPFFRQRFGEIR